MSLIGTMLAFLGFAGAARQPKERDRPAEAEDIYLRFAARMNEDEKTEYARTLLAMQQAHRNCLQQAATAALDPRVGGGGGGSHVISIARAAQGYPPDTCNCTPARHDLIVGNGRSQRV